MRIAVDARLNAYRQGGIPQYSQQLLSAMADAAPQQQFICLAHQKQQGQVVDKPNVQQRRLYTPPHHRFEQYSLPLEILPARPSILHSPDFITPKRRLWRAVITIHDLAFIHYPEILDNSAKRYYGQIQQIAPKADAIIAVSESTRQDIVQQLGIPAERIAVIHEAAAPQFQPMQLAADASRRIGETTINNQQFMLFTSTIEPRKNLPTLLQALRICIDRQPKQNYRLVIAGARGWRDSLIYETVKNLKLGDYVSFVGSVSPDELVWLYNACRIYINPSLYEGFGLPLLEAMACGAACLASDTSSLPEVGGDAAEYISPLDAQHWADRIAAFWQDSDLRARYSAKSLQRAQQFSWAQAAKETLQVYQYALKGKGQLPISPTVPAKEQGSI